MKSRRELGKDDKRGKIQYYPTDSGHCFVCRGNYYGKKDRVRHGVRHSLAFDCTFFI